MLHQHCDRCYSVNCGQTSVCPMIQCPDDCSARMHSCKVEDHQHVCPNILVSCPNVSYGCPLKLRRHCLAEHLLTCAASVVVCSFSHAYQNYSLDNHNPKMLPDILARRDNLWSNHFSEVEQKQRSEYEKWSIHRRKANVVERLIRSAKYPYITMPECMLSRNDGIICMTCRLHLRQLEENEESRLIEAGEQSNEHSSVNKNDNESSLVKMSLTKIEMANSSLPLAETSEPLITENAKQPTRSDIDFPTSFLYRMKYFSTDHSNEEMKSVDHSPNFHCLAFCRRDEFERHQKIHHFIDRELNSVVFERCPKSQYGCPFQIQQVEARLKNDQTVRVRFDSLNDAIAYEYDPTIDLNVSSDLTILHFPDEIIIQILNHLDSLSLRNISLVCHRLRNLCETMVTSHGIVVNEYERCLLSHGETSWIERRQHWLFTNTTSSIDSWRTIERSSNSSVSQHINQCQFGPTNDLNTQKPFPLVNMVLTTTIEQTSQ